MSLTDFLLARIAEDEAAVEGIRQGEDPDFFWGPDRIRAECEAKRQIVAIHQRREFYRPGGITETCSECGPGWPCRTLRFIALPYADNDDTPPTLL